MFRTFLAPAILALALTAPGARAEQVGVETVVATVGGVEITLGHMIALRTSLPPEYQDLPDDALWEGILDQLVQQEALAQSRDAVETLYVQLSLQNERRAALASQAVTAIADRAVSEEALLAAYDATYGTAEGEREYNASHILVESEAEALEILQQARSGSDFADLARKFSTGPSAQGGGSLGWFGPGMMVAPFQSAIESLSPTEVTGPVETQFGWHVIRLNEMRIKEAPTLDEVRGELVQKVQRDAIESRIQSLLAASNVTRQGIAEIDTSLLSRTDLLE